MANISRDQLKKEISAILKNADLSKTTAKKVRSLLEEKLGVNLSTQKKTVDDLVIEYLSQQEQRDKGDDDEDEEDDDPESEEEPKKKVTKRKAPAKKAATESDDEEDASEGDDDDEYSPKKAKKSPGKKGRGKKKGSDSDSDEDWGKKNSKRRGAGKGYTKPLKLSKDLSKLMGAEEMARHEVVKKMWALIKERNLYDPKNKQFAICDDELYKVIGEKRFRIFGMMKYLKAHFQ